MKYTCFLVNLKRLVSRLFPTYCVKSYNITIFLCRKKVLSLKISGGVAAPPLPPRPPLPPPGFYGPGLDVVLPLHHYYLVFFHFPEQAILEQLVARKRLSYKSTYTHMIVMQLESYGLKIFKTSVLLILTKMSLQRFNLPAFFSVDYLQLSA